MSSLMLKENVFSEINSDNQAYWIGFLAADGSVNGNQLQIGLSAKNIEHLYHFKNLQERKILFALK